MLGHLHIDPFSGIAGDMFLGAMIDLGAPLPAIEQALARLPIESPFELSIRRVQRHGIGAVDFKVQLTNDRGHAHQRGHSDHHDHSHHAHTGYREIMAMVDQLQTTERGKQRAGGVVTALAQAEARVHGKALDELHFHEVGAVDSIVDMLGSVLAIELMEIETISCGPLPLSRGFVKCAHGVMPVPAPATAYLLENLPTVGVDRVGELITPTGAAIVAALADSFGPPPAMTLKKVGYGAGDREDPSIPNLVRLMGGERLPAGSLGPTQPSTAAAE